MVYRLVPKRRALPTAPHLDKSIKFKRAGANFILHLFILSKVYGIVNSGNGLFISFVLLLTLKVDAASQFMVAFSASFSFFAFGIVLGNDVICYSWDLCMVV